MAKPRRKKRTHVPEAKDPAKKGDPKSFVFRRGRHGLIMKDLEADLRKVMAPNTGAALRESKRNVLKDFVHIAGPLGVTHFLILTATQNASYLRIAKTPRGPTLTMRVHQYALMRDVAASQPRPRTSAAMFAAPPLLVMNQFSSGAEHLKLAVVLFQNLFPPINVQTVKLGACQRVVLLSYSKDSGRISFRHFSIRVAPSGVTKSLKGLLAGDRLPDMHDFADVSEFLTRSGYGSESEGEEAAESRVTLAQDMGKGNVAARQSRIKLQEIGPRMELEIVKVEEGLCDGRILFHAHVEKSDAERAALQERKETAVQLKDARRKQQEENVRRKEHAAKRKAVETGKFDADARGAAKRQRMWWEEEIAHGRRGGTGVPRSWKTRSTTPSTTGRRWARIRTKTSPWEARIAAAGAVAGAGGVASAVAAAAAVAVVARASMAEAGSATAAGGETAEGHAAGLLEQRAVAEAGAEAATTEAEGEGGLAVLEAEDKEAGDRGLCVPVVAWAAFDRLSMLLYAAVRVVRQQALCQCTKLPIAQALIFNAG